MNPAPDDSLIKEFHPKGGKSAIEKFGFYRENKSFFDDIRNGKLPVHDLASSLQAMEIFDCMQQNKSDYTRT